MEPAANVMRSASLPPHVSWFRKSINILGCIAVMPVYWFMTVHCRYPITLDLIVTIILAELNRLFNEGRRMAFYEESSRATTPVDEKFDPEKQLGTPKLECMAAIVGWREDPFLFTRALESYRSARCCNFLLTGIDGDESADQDMVNVFNGVFPDRSQTIHVTTPLGEVAEKVRGKMIKMQEDSGLAIDLEKVDEIVMGHCLQLARTILDQENVNLGGEDGIRQLCISQPHMHKKGIMFTTFAFSLVIADMLGTEFLWSSDSDTLVMPDSLERTLDAFAVDPKIGGASSGLIVHNETESIVTQLASTVYWGELYLTRSMPAPTATSDCQSGPSTAFRLSALPPLLIPWYMQTVMGKRMIINEDRHLTTNLLCRGWGVVFASDVLAVTDTPTSLARWIKQQVRWGRATHIESLLQPKAYLMSHPLLFHSMARREFGPIIAAVAIVYYFIFAEKIIVMSLLDVALRVFIASGYNVLRNPHRLTKSSLRWVIPGMFFYHIPLPAIHVWSMLTLTADGWGTSMRASGEQEKKESTRQAWWETGFFVGWMGVVAGTLARIVCGYLHLHWAHELLATSICVALASFLAWNETINKLTD